LKRREFLVLTAGTAIAWPVVARTQQKQMPAIGFLGSTLPGPSANITAFHQGLNETGYVEGQNVAIEYRWAEGRYDRLLALAADLCSAAIRMERRIASPENVLKTSSVASPPVFPLPH